jgi:tRNA G10  N-methylase Trm11
MDFLFRLAQVHETFRLPELRAIAVVEGIEMHVLEYDLDVDSVPLRMNATYRADGSCSIRSVS